MAEGILINGLVQGGIYALLAIGFALIFGVARMINLAHTAFYMLAAYWLFYFGEDLGWPLGVSIALALISTTIIGMLSYKLFIERIREHHMTVLLVTLAMAIACQESLGLQFGNAPVSVHSFISGFQEIAGVKVLNQRLLALGTAAVLLPLLWLILNRTRLGIAVRASSQDAEIANVMGIDVRRTLVITVGMAIALAAIAGIVIGPTLGTRPTMWIHPLIMVMAIVVLGGLGSLKGAFIAAFLMGYVEVSVIHLIPEYSFLAESIALGVMVIILMVRPEGLFGISFEEERL